MVLGVLCGPEVVLWENVRGMQTLFASTLGKIVKELQGMRYHVEHRILNASEHGLPQNRERLFILAVRSDVWPGGSFPWPEPVQRLRLSDLLDPLTPAEKKKDLNHAFPSGRPRKRAKQIYKEIREAGFAPASKEFVIDVGASNVRAMYGKSPCLTRTRATSGGHWLVQRGRMMTLAEMERLQGIGVAPPHGGRSVHLVKPGNVSSREWSSLIGNSIAIPCLQRILARVLKMCFNIQVPDPWQKP